jgi:chromodomain-helicase-DNA-binding protein 1
MTTTTSIQMANGYHSPVANIPIANDAASYDSESDLSELREPPAVEGSPSPSSTPHHQSDFGNEDTEPSGESEDDNDKGSDNDDFDGEESILVVAHPHPRIDRSSSHDSRRPTKRKLGIEDNEYIKANPELYGLRRSVCTYTELWS